MNIRKTVSLMDRWHKSLWVSMRWHLIATDPVVAPADRLRARTMAVVMMDRVSTRGSYRRQHEQK